MAKENTSSLVGKVNKIEINTENKVIALTLDVMRRNGRIDSPDIIIYKQHFDIAKDVKEGDYVMVKGFLSTRQIEEPIVCVECGEVLRKNVIKSYLIGFYLDNLGTNHSLEEFREVSNNVILLGPLCKNIRFRQLPSGIKNSQYQMAISRRMRIAEEAEVSTDFPFISSLDEQAEEDNRRMEEGSQCYINGGLQTRISTKTLTCSKCSNVTRVQEKILEVCPYNVEYLFNCKF